MKLLSRRIERRRSLDNRGERSTSMAQPNRRSTLEKRTKIDFLTFAAEKIVKRDGLIVACAEA